MTAAQLLGLGAKTAVISVVGCGGKTTLIASLAQSQRHRRVLLTPTTKIYPPFDLNCPILTDLVDIEQHQPQLGIQCMGLPSGEKLRALPPALLSHLIPHYDLVLLEADGSKGLPCKGWLPSEPVIPIETTHTVAIVTLNGLDKPATEQWVHRLPQFTALTGCPPDRDITTEVLLRMLGEPEGMLHHRRGQVSLLLNQVTDPAQAINFLTAFGQFYPDLCHHLAYGSAISDQWTEVFP